MAALRRLFWLAMFGGAGFAGWTVWQRRNEPTGTDTPEWPPIDTPGTAQAVVSAVPTAADPSATSTADSADSADTTNAAAADPSGRWVPPVDGQCPPSHPIKANDNSGIYHRPGGRFYDRTVPERCYAEPADAEADGYRAAKS